MLAPQVARGGREVLLHSSTTAAGEKLRFAERWFAPVLLPRLMFKGNGLHVNKTA